jgi:phosphodiesterase/alkaline phosphatase D-like protein
MYGPPPFYSYSLSSTNMVTAHSVTLTGLSPNRQYHYRLLSRDAAGNATVSGELTFMTKPQ